MNKIILLIGILAILLLSGCTTTVEETSEKEVKAKVNIVNNSKPTNDEVAMPEIETTIPEDEVIVKEVLGVTSKELTEHNLKSDCWVGYENKVYDLTKWLPKHPGSSAAIEPYCGTSSEFEDAFEGQHGTYQVKKMLEESIFIDNLV